MDADRSNRNLPQRTYVIVGAGLAGASTAYHLRRAGVTDVVVLERERTPGEHSSGRNAAILRGDAEAPALGALTRESVDVLRRGGLAPFHACGGYFLGEGESDVRERLTFVHGRGRWCPDDGVVDVAALLATYLRGIDVRTQTELRGFAPAGDGLRLDTSQGPMRAAVLVNAAGAWAGALGSLPLVPTNRHLHVTTPIPRVDPNAPFVWDLQAGYYIRPESGGLLLSGCDETPGSPGEPDADPLALEHLAEKLRLHQPALAEIEILRSWVGQRTFARDRCPVIGFDPRTPRLFHMAGFGGFGVTVSYAAGRYAAGLLCGEEPADRRLAVERLLPAPEGASAG